MINPEYDVLKIACDHGYKNGSIDSLLSLGKALETAKNELVSLSPEELFKTIAYDIIPISIKQIQDKS